MSSRNLTLSTGICLPDVCSFDDTTRVAAIVLNERGMALESVSCESIHLIRFRTRIVAVVIFATLLLTVVLSTIYELYMKRQRRELEI